MITTVEEMIRTYVEAWNHDTLEEFKDEFAKCWTDETWYVDPEFEIKGIDAIANLAQISLERIPGRKFSVAIQPEYHHNCGRYTWQVDFNNETKQGFDYFEFNKEFKITRISSFF